ncbi:MAG: perosamine synthetase, partial [Thermoanaerobaculia bacterium]|nr:perosamine synthetase [Thermoanaerobaculia bacterium]
MKAIHAYPRPSIATLRRKPSAAMREEIAFAPHLTRFSRDALYLVFSAFGASPGTPVWCPSFHCGMEVRAAAEAGFTPRFYRLRDDLTIDEEHLARCLAEATGPVLLIHYFGFAQPGIDRIAALCRAKRVPLIEDCSHAFLSRCNGRAIGTAGDAATFSLYKTFGTSDGGALRFDRTIELPPRPRVAWSAQWGSIRRRWRDRPPRAHAEEVIARRFSRRSETAWRHIFEDPWQAPRGISKLSLALIERFDPAQIV